MKVPGVTVSSDKTENIVTVHKAPKSLLNNTLDPHITRYRMDKNNYVVTDTGASTGLAVPENETVKSVIETVLSDWYAAAKLSGIV